MINENKISLLYLAIDNTSKKIYDPICIQAAFHNNEEIHYTSLPFVILILQCVWVFERLTISKSKT